MSKRKTKNSHNSKSKPSFLVFWCKIARKMGRNRLRLNESADCLGNLFHKSSQHGELEREVILKSYEFSHCESVHDQIDVTHVLDIMGETAYNKQLHNQDDLMDIELLEEIAFHLQNLYREEIMLPESGNNSQNNPSSAMVLSLAKAKIHFANRLKV